MTFLDGKILLFSNEMHVDVLGSKPELYKLLAFELTKQLFKWKFGFNQSKI